MKSKIADQLVAHLREEAQAYKGLHKLLQQEREALVEWAIGDLREVVKQKESQLEEIHQLEDRRVEFLDEVQSELKKAGLDFLATKETLNLTDIINAVKKEERKPLLEIQQDLAQLVKDVTTTNHTNQLLLKRSYELVNANLNIYAQSEKLARTYGANGEFRPTGTTHLVDGAI